jgi:hypothetical protein
VESDPLLPDEIICPYSKVQCIDYGMCNRKDSKLRKSIAVNAHDVRYKIDCYNEVWDTTRTACRIAQQQVAAYGRVV